MPTTSRTRFSIRYARLALERLEDRTVPSRFEVWTIDQSNTRDNDGNGTLDSGGTLYVYEGRSLAQHPNTVVPERIDLGGNTYHQYMVGATGEAGVRPHMLLFNSTGSHAIIAHVTSGHILFLDARTRLPVGVVDVDPQAHAAFPSADDRYLIVANQNGKLLHRIFTDYATNTFTLDPTPLELAPLELPGLRPDNRPICPIITADSRFTFVTLAGGGMFVVQTEASAPMSIVADYTNAVVHREGCGGIEVNGKMYINAGSAGHSDLYAFDLADFDTTPNPTNSPPPRLIFTQDGDPTTSAGRVDSHGIALSKHGRYLWVADRWANKIVVVDTRSDQVVNEIALSGAVSADPAPDLLDFSPNGNRIFMALRGPNPLTANNPAFNNAVGATPGVGVIEVTRGGRSGRFVGVARISHRVGGVERADPHALRVRDLSDEMEMKEARLAPNANWGFEDRSWCRVDALPSDTRHQTQNPQALTPRLADESSSSSPFELTLANEGGQGDELLGGLGDDWRSGGPGLDLLDGGDGINHLFG